MRTVWQEEVKAIELEERIPGRIEVNRRVRNREERRMRKR